LKVVERLFVAIRLPERVRERLGRVQAELRALLPPRVCSWVKPEAMHLTLRFLGDVRVDVREELIRQLGHQLDGQPQLYLQAERLGCFPNLRFPRVIWAWVHDKGEPDATGLKRLQQAVAAASSGYTSEPSEATFQGHITLSRVKQVRRSHVATIAGFVEKASATQFGDWLCEHVELLQSEQTSSGSRYTPVAEWRLKA
jgi:2'-5' RNA ligase